MQLRLLPPPFGRGKAADVKSSCNPKPAGRARGVSWRPRLILAGLLSLIVSAMPQTSFGAVRLKGLTCASSSFTGSGTESCTVTLSGTVNRTELVCLTTTNRAVNVLPDAFVQPGQSRVQFTAPVRAVSSVQTATITAEYGGVSKTFAVELSPAASASPAMTVSQTSVSFGTITLNAPTSKSVIITSSGTGALTLNSVTASGTGFSVSGGTFPMTLNPGQTATLTISFDPTAAGSFTGAVTISSNASTATVTLSGTGQTASTLSALSCSSGSLTGAGTDACTVTLTSAATTATTVTLTSSSSAVTVPASVTIASGSTSAAFTAIATAVNSTQTATLTATATGVSKTFALTLNATTPKLTLGSSSVAFGTAALNTTVTKTVTLTSSGTAALTLSGASASGTGFGDSGMTFPVTLNPGQTATLTISFDPTTAGSLTGAVTISSNAASATISLSGTGQAPATLSTVSCSSGSLTGAGTDACTVALTSAATSATTVTLSSSSSAVTVPASVTIASGSSSAGFTATATAVSSTQTATLTATATGVSKTFALTLNATTPNLTLSATNVAFGNVQLDTPATQSVTMTSSGTAAVTVSAGTLSGSGFSMPGSKFPVTLNPGQTQTLEIQFDPSTADAAAGTVALSSNCSMGAMIVTLSGTGATATSYEVQLSWAAPASSSDPVVGYHIYRANSGGSYQLLNSSVNQPTAYNDTTVQAGATYNYEVTSVDAAGVESAPSNVYSAAIQ